MSSRFPSHSTRRIARKPLTALALAALAVLASRNGVAAGPAAAPVYFPTGLMLAKRTTVPAAMNESGRVVGTLTRKRKVTTDGFVGQDGRVTALPKLKHRQAVASGINNLGEIVGAAAAVSPKEWYPLLWRNDLAIDLGRMTIFPGGREVGAFDINDRGQIVGGTGRAFLRDGDVVTDLGTLGGTGSVAYAINEAGQIVGGADVETGDLHAFLWQDGVMQDLGTLGGPSSVAYDINEQGQVVGVSTVSAGDTRAFLWENGVMRSLGTLPGYTSSEAYAINDHGQVVGICRQRKGNNSVTAPVLWDGDAIIDLRRRLGSNGWNFNTAVDINNRGQILGTGSFLRKKGTVLLTPAAEDLSASWQKVELKCRGLRAPQCRILGTLVIRNLSTRAVGNSRVKFYLSGDQEVDASDTLLASTLVAPISAGSERRVQLKFRLSRGQRVTGKRVLAVIDADNVYPEEDETNNLIVSGPLP